MRTIKFIYGAILCLSFLPALATQTLTCVSPNNTFAHCRLSYADQRDIRITSVQSGDCSADNAWGVDSRGIWVNNGCGAVFEYTQVASSNNDDDGETVIVIDPDFLGAFYGPGFYYGAGYYNSYGWGNQNNDYCNNYRCNSNQQHNYNHYNNVNHNRNGSVTNNNVHNNRNGAVTQEHSMTNNSNNPKAVNESSSNNNAVKQSREASHPHHNTEQPAVQNTSHEEEGVDRKKDDHDEPSQGDDSSGHKK